MRWLIIVLLAASAVVAPALPTSYAAISIRQYREQGPSFLRIFIYRLDGTLIRELPEEPGVDDTSPAISRDGRLILLKRRPANSQGAATWKIFDMATGEFRVPAPTEAEIAGYEATLAATEFGEANTSTPSPSNQCSSTDNRYVLSIRPNPAWNESSDPITVPRFLYFLLSRGSFREENLASFPGYAPYGTTWTFLSPNENPFVKQPGFDALFMTQHMNSTAGASLWAFDLHSRNWSEMSGNAGVVYQIPDQQGVAFIHSSRYEELGKSGLTVTCGYLEFWGANFKPIRLGPPVSLFYGAAIFYAEGKTVELKDPDFGS